MSNQIFYTETLDNLWCDADSVWLSYDTTSQSKRGVQLSSASQDINIPIHHKAGQMFQKISLGSTFAEQIKTLFAIQ